MTVHTIQVPASFEHLAAMRSQLMSILDRDGILKREVLQDLRLAVSEGTTNAIEAHDRAAVTAPVVVTIEVTDDRVVIVIVDQGPGFDPKALKPHPPVTDPARLDYERGLGVTLMRTLTDGCLIESGDGGTTVTLTVLR